MLNISLPDGSKKSYNNPVSGYDIAKDISTSLAKAALAVKVNDNLWDLHREITFDATVEIITAKNTDIALELIRHDCAHVMAQAVQEIWQDVQVTIGPAIENGFYYDFDKTTPFTEADLETIEKRMHKIIERNDKFERHVWSKEQAINFFKEKGEEYKVELIEDLPEGEEISIYCQGDWYDLCRGPHLPSTKYVGKAFKLMKVAGAYWRGDSSRAQLQRIYGTAWLNKEGLDGYLEFLKEAELRDHRNLGKQMAFFHMQDTAPGMIFWHPKGWRVYRRLQTYIRSRLNIDYQEVNTPQLINRELWEASGHWEKFREDMFVTGELEGEQNIAIKPMNCPGHVQVFKQGIKSYRDLPLRLSEFGSCHRNEPSGALHGIMRVRNFVQDDAHIFCSEEQIVSETKKFCDLLDSIYKDLGFSDYFVKLSDRPEKRAGSDEIWDHAEKALKDAAESSGLQLEMNPGEGAFYGPKLEFVLKDVLGRHWQCGTLQLDIVLPERLGATYVDKDGQKRHPVMLHRAILGSIERFLGILIENYAGRLPLWLSPVQVVVTTVTSGATDYAIEVHKKLLDAGIMAEIDYRNEKINYKVREHSHAKVPVMFVVGMKEEEDKTVAIRYLGDKGQEVLSLDDAIDTVVKNATGPDGKLMTY